MYISFIFYKRQKDKVVAESWPLPIFNHLLHFAPYFKNNENKHATKMWGEKTLDMPRFNKTSLFYAFHEPIITVCDVNVVEQLYTTHNSLFDKHPLSQHLTHYLLGRSILFDESNQNWRQRRKAMSPAFYKGKLQGLVEISKDSVR